MLDCQEEVLLPKKIKIAYEIALNGNYEKALEVFENIESNLIPQRKYRYIVYFFKGIAYTFRSTHRYIISVEYSEIAIE